MAIARVLRALLAIPALASCGLYGSKENTSTGTGGSASTCGADLQNDAKNCGGCGHDCLAAACVKGECTETVLAGNQLTPTGIAIGPDEVYWTNYVANGSVLRCAKGGCGGAPGALATNQTGPWAIAFAETRVFWSELDAGRTWCRALDPAARPAVNLNGAVASTVLFAQDRFVYTNAADYGVPDIEAITQWHDDGCTSTSTAAGVEAQPGALSLVAQGTTLYWIAGGEIRSCDILDGCKAADVKTVVPAQPDAHALAVDPFTVYWTNESGTVMSAPLTGGAPAALASGLAHPWAIAVLGDVYFTTVGPGDAIVAKVPKDGGPMTVLKSGAKRPFALALDDQFVYWTDADDGTVNRVPR